MSPPTIELSTTLHDLYNLDGGDAKDVVLAYAVPANTKRALSTACPAVQKYAYQSPLSKKVGPDTTARFLLGCFSQHDGFIAGPMDFRMFDLDKTKLEQAADSLPWGAWGGSRERSHRSDARRTYSSIREDQQPNVTWIEKPDDLFNLKPKKLAVLSPMDFLDRPSGESLTLVEQEVHWEMLSKRTLATSNLPTPPTEIIETEFAVEDSDSEEARNAETARMLQSIEHRALPFVVKLPYGYGGHAVFVLRDEEQRSRCLSILQQELPAFLPTCLLIQEPLPGISSCVSFFVTHAGRGVFVCCSEEVHDAKGGWTGGVMDYEAQSELATRYGDLIQQAADYVFEKGFYGPMGFDVMTDESGVNRIVDLNVRQTGSYVLGLMKRHFLENQNLPFAGLLCPLPIMGDRDAFQRKFAEEIECGKLVITSWCHGKAAGGWLTYSAAGMVIGAESREELLASMARINACAIKI